MSFTNKIAVITGGSSGIGKAIAKDFAEKNATVIILDIDKEKSVKTVNELKNLGERDSFYLCDISNKSEVEKVFASIVKEHGKVDILVNNAGISIPGNFEDQSEEDFKRVMDINFYGTYNCIKTAIPIMLKNSFGRIVNIASTAGKVGSRFIAAYVASKHAVVGLTKACALEYASKDIIINAVCPGMTETELTENSKDLWGKMFKVDGDTLYSKLKSDVPIGRFLYSEEIAQLVTFLASPEQKAITGQSILIDGGKYTL